MDFQTFIVLLLLNVLRTSMSLEVEYDSDPDVHWDNFKKTYQKTYDPSETLVRRANFEANLKTINKHNLEYEQGLHTYYLGLSEYADMLIEEFQKTMNGYKAMKTNRTKNLKTPLTEEVPDSIDWRDEGAVTPVKNQGSCGSCYAFAATGALEGQNKIKKGELVSLSEQNIVDCSGPYGNNECGGGLMEYSYDYVIANKGLDTEDSYPYTGKEGSCMYKAENSASTCSNYYEVEPDEDHLKEAVATIGPISVAIDASQDSLQLYSGGIYDEKRCTDGVDHAVLVVGYGSENGNDYWIVKNSWGEEWGEGGYVRMSRNKNDQCGISSLASYPTV